MEAITESMDAVRRMNVRQVVEQIVSFGLIVSTALIIWKTLMIVSGSESPIVVVLSGSMRPAIHRGDLLFLYQSQKPFNIGEITVYNVGVPIPIVHRLLNLHEKPDNSVEILTRGDNNTRHDRPLYHGRNWLKREHILGRSFAFFPYMGMMTIWMTDFPLLKYSLIGMLGLFVIINRE
eukprot:TRINITY_DN2410_c0_g1_i1.p1 TRINITY_DN2410_c0_g1~~TRINITY_DN2410_c0_g1_i1.p1  ORF type:complete len:178 (+),score=20.06 TRINITY_DN2410_c0_g1_i1:107-640(+)